MARQTPAEAPTGRVAQLRTAFEMTRRSDPRLIPLMFGPALVVLAGLVVAGVLTNHVIYLTVLGVLLAVAIATFVFGRRATGAMYAQVEGQPGAAAAVVQTMRGNWKVTPAVAFNRNQDLVHRAVGRPGIVLIGEGVPTRVSQLVTQERKRVTRVAADVPVYEVQVGDAEGQVTLRRLQQHLMKLPRNLKSNQVDIVESRLRALGGTSAPLPKGPIPRSGRIPRGKMR